MSFFDQIKKKLSDTFNSNNGEQKMVQVYKGKFRKSDGSVREMRYISYKDALANKLVAQPKNSKKSNHQPGQELVYDMDKKSLRIFNHNTKIGDLQIQTTEI